MTRELDAQILSAIEQETLYPILAVQLNLDTQTLRLWSGYGTKKINGSNFIGVGTLLRVSEIQETAELYAAGATVSLSGVPSDMLSLALNERYQGRKAFIYFAALANDASWILDDGTWRNGGVWNDGATWSESGVIASQMFSGYLDQMNIDEQPETSTIAVTIESKLIDLERPRVYNYSSQTQKAIYANDKGFDFVESLQNKTYNWGRT